MRVEGAEVVGAVELEAVDGEATFDPVCGRALAGFADDAVRLTHRGQVFHFCSEGCRERFERLAERIRVEEVLKMGALFAPSERVRWGVA